MSIQFVHRLSYNCDNSSTLLSVAMISHQNRQHFQLFPVIIIAFDCHIRFHLLVCLCLYLYLYDWYVFNHYHKHSFIFYFSFFSSRMNSSFLSNFLLFLKRLILLCLFSFALMLLVCLIYIFVFFSSVYICTIIFQIAILIQTKCIFKPFGSPSIALVTNIDA